MLFSKQRGKVLMTVSSMDFLRGLCLTITLALASEASLAEQLPAMNTAITDAAPISGLAPDHITLSVEDIDGEADWYVRVLGFTLESKGNPRPEAIRVRLTLSGYHIDLIKYQGSKRPAPVNPLYLQQGWIHAVFRVDDLAATVKQLQALHVEPKEINFDKDIPSRIYLRDPENNEIEITRNQR
jgi:catechol 2,3-dioxygenase-like lactoylglutathione lyase family enzyme